MYEKIIIEQLDKMAQVALRPEDMARWNKTKETLLQGLDRDNMNDICTASYFQLQKYDGTDFQFKKSKPMHEPGAIVIFKLGDMTGAIPAFIRARHEYSGRWKYDMEIAVKMPDAWHVTRLYNIEEKWLSVIR
jgi:hypothetical protein